MQIMRLKKGGIMATRVSDDDNCKDAFCKREREMLMKENSSFRWLFNAQDRILMRLDKRKFNLRFYPFDADQGYKFKK